MIKLYVIRHGETDFNKEGRYLGRSSVSLNSTGIVQARKLAQGVEELGIEVIYVSPSNRTLETANIINENKYCKRWAIHNASPVVMSYWLIFLIS